MKFSRLRRLVGQTSAEYMIMLSVGAFGAMAALLLFSHPGNPVQVGAEGLAKDMEKSLSNDDGGSMKVR